MAPPRKPEPQTQAIQQRPPSPHKEMREQVRALAPYLNEVFPKALGITPERFIRVVVNCIESDPTGKLGQCTHASMVRAILHSAELGLEPGGARGLAWLIPYWNKDANAYEASFMVGAYGYVELARRSGEIEDVWTDLIFEADEFSVQSGSAGRVLSHVPAWHLSEEKRGALLGAYACARLKTGRVLVELVNIEDIERARQSNRSKNMPAWDMWYGEMAKKVAIKRAQKLWPKGLDGPLARAIEVEDKPEMLSDASARALAETTAVAELPQNAGALDRVVAIRERKQTVQRSQQVASKMVDDAAPGGGAPGATYASGGNGDPEDAISTGAQGSSNSSPNNLQVVLSLMNAKWKGARGLGIVSNWTPAEREAVYIWVSGPRDSEPPACMEQIHDRVVGEEG